MEVSHQASITLVTSIPSHNFHPIIFNMQGTRWCFTLNNYAETDLPSILKWNARYLVVGSEVSETGTPHLQGFVIFKKNYRMAGLKKLLPTAHWELARGNSTQAAEYCKKDGDFKEIGILSQQGKRTDLENACVLIKETNSLKAVAEEYPTTVVKYGRGLRDYMLLINEPYEHTSTRGIWIYGPPGTGKSHCARHFDPNAYLKPQSKWWDGYNGEATVILDDLDTGVLGHHLKIWSDKWACTGETKGGTVNLQHRLFVVTSNYSIDELFEDFNMREALARRFKTIFKSNRNELVDFLTLT